ncbi:MAG: hypothetical protein K9J37_03665 [Saprospiraceae bacterium]|nr:hypothetical protein [Saprospiraceae bacterium]MCF8248981.1 hypothetical protein [Saprospiraceae bacterium]MCF8279192.1 hypothetical protein [Bacteroidales bacterium]MCF8310875.1 hypothetical protein [Saprospiraceae bacterium]MCF8439537.1 hypothetical protein [Saprospiraceae bacterium]
MKNLIIFIQISLLSFSVISCEKKTVELPSNNEEAGTMPLPIAIHSDVCYWEGESLTVFNPETGNFQTYNQDVYAVVWKIGAEQVGSGTRLECVCGATYTVVVEQVVTGASAQMDYTAVDCRDK